MDPKLHTFFHGTWLYELRKEGGHEQLHILAHHIRVQQNLVLFIAPC
jgi:hypothetical protein